MPWTDPNHRRAHRRKRKPCGSNKPKNVENISGQYQRTEGMRHNLFRLRVDWNRVTETQAGEEYTPDAYGIQVWGSPDGTTWDKENIRHKQVRGSAGPDGDWGTEDDTKVPNWVVFRNIKPKWYYKIRVRALSKKECDGVFGSWVSLGQASDNVKPAAPLNVRIFENSTGKRVVLDWDEPTDPADSEQVDQGVTFFQVQLATASSFGSGTIYKFDRIQAASHRSFRIAEADLAGTFYGRVRSIDAAGNKSDWIPATVAGNSSSSATASGVQVGSSSGNFIATFSHGGPVPAPRLFDAAWEADRNYKIVKARVRIGVHSPTATDDSAAHPNDGCPLGADGSAVYVQIRKYAADDSSYSTLFTSDTRLKVDKNTHKDTAWADDMSVTTVSSGESLAVRVTKSSGITYAGKGLVVQVVLEPA